MLILTQGRGDRVVIGKKGDVLTEPIVVSFLELRGRRARLGFTVQKDIDVLRGELTAAKELLSAAAADVAQAQAALDAAGLEAGEE